MVLCGCQGGDSNTSWPSLNTLWMDQKAKKLSLNKKYDEALGLYSLLLGENQNQASLHSNLGVLLSMTDKTEEALKSLQLAKTLTDQQDPSKLKFATRFNLGVFYAEKKNFEKALESYQMALEVDPSNKETKHNIELLIQQQQKDQNQKQQQQNKDQDQNKNKDQNQDQNKDQQNKDKEDQGKPEDQNKKDDEKDQQQPKDEKKEVQSSQRYKPRPFKGDQLSEGDVKKILGELRSQEQKIRANYDKKERKDTRNEKDW